MGTKRVTKNITEQKRKSKVHSKTGKKYPKIIEHIPAMIYQAGTDWVPTICGKYISVLTGYTKKELTSGKVKWLDIIFPEDKERVLRESTILLKKPCDITQEYRLVRKDGKITWVQDKKISYYEKGKLKYIEGIVLDITKRKQAEKKLEESESRFKAVFENAGSAIYIADIETGNILACNTEAEKLVGRTRKEIIGMHQSELHPEGEQKKYQEKFALHVQKCHVVDFKGEVQHKDGRRIPVLIAARVLKMNDKNAIMGVFVDITEPNQEYKTLTESSLTGIFIHQGGRFMFVNDRFAEMHGYKTEELIGKGHLTLIHPDEREKLREMASKRLRGETVPERYEVRRIRKNGETIWCEMMATCIQYRGKPAIMGNIIDITERKKAEEALKEREKELKIKTDNLEEANIALKVLLKRRDEDKTELEEKVLLNIKELVVPYFKKLKTTGLDEKQNTYLNILESNLNDITSSFSVRLSSKYLNLTPTEIQVTNLIGQGKESKEIAELLNSSPRTIAFHRERIRKKLGLRNKKTNLKAYLMSSF
jgi:PAS domain S-box-containing protein